MHIYYRKSSQSICTKKKITAKSLPYFDILTIPFFEEGKVYTFLLPAF